MLVFENINFTGPTQTVRKEKKLDPKPWKKQKVKHPEHVSAVLKLTNKKKKISSIYCAGCLATMGINIVRLYY